MSSFYDADDVMRAINNIDCDCDCEYDIERIREFTEHINSALEKHKKEYPEEQSDYRYQISEMYSFFQIFIAER